MLKSRAPRRVGPNSAYFAFEKIGKGSFSIVWRGLDATNLRIDPATSDPHLQSIRQLLTHTPILSNTQNHFDQSNNHAVSSLYDPSIQWVAIKQISRGKVRGKLAENLEKEIQVLKNLTKKSLQTQRNSFSPIVKLFDEITTENNKYLILEYGDGSDLSKKLGELGGKGIPEPLIHHLGQYLVAGVRILNEERITHRDLKPHNLLLFRNQSNDQSSIRYLNRSVSSSPFDDLYNYHLKIADFGFARELAYESMATTLCGSPLYMAPEILNHSEYSITADLWSVGTILYEMAFGKPPFDAISPAELLKRIKDGEKKKHQEIQQSDLSNELKHLISGLLVVHPSKRITFEQFFNHPFWGQSNHQSPNQSSSNPSASRSNSQSRNESVSQLTSPTTNQSFNAAFDGFSLGDNPSINQSIERMTRMSVTPPHNQPNNPVVQQPVSQLTTQLARRASNQSPSQSINHLQDQSNSPSSHSPIDEAHKPPPLHIMSPPGQATPVEHPLSVHALRHSVNQPMNRASNQLSASQSFDIERRSANQPNQSPISSSPSSSSPLYNQSQSVNQSSNQSSNLYGDQSRRRSRADSMQQSVHQSGSSIDDYVCVDSPNNQTVPRSINQPISQPPRKSSDSRGLPPRSPSINSINQAYQPAYHQSVSHSYNQSMHQSISQSYNQYNNNINQSLYQSRDWARLSESEIVAYIRNNVRPSYAASLKDTLLCKALKEGADLIYQMSNQTNNHLVVQPLSHINIQSTSPSCKSLFLGSCINDLLCSTTQYLTLNQADNQSVNQPVDQAIDLDQCALALYVRCLETSLEKLKSIQQKFKEFFLEDLPIDSLPQARKLIEKEMKKWIGFIDRLKDDLNYVKTRAQEIIARIKNNQSNSQSNNQMPHVTVFDCRTEQPYESLTQSANQPLSQPIILFDQAALSRPVIETESIVPSHLFMFSMLAQYFWKVGLQLENMYSLHNQSLNQSFNQSLAQSNSPVPTLQEALDCYEIADSLFHLALLELPDSEDEPSINQSMIEHDEHSINQAKKQVEWHIAACRKRSVVNDTPRSRSSSIASSPSMNHLNNHLNNPYSPSLSHSPSDNPMSVNQHSPSFGHSLSPSPSFGPMKYPPTTVSG